MKLRHVMFATLAVLYATAALAQTAGVKTPGQTEVLNWNAPTGVVGGGAIAGTLTYNVYLVGNATPIATGLLATTFTTAPLTAGTPCWDVTAVLNGVESAPSAQFCATVQAAPNPPTGLTGH